MRSCAALCFPRAPATRRKPRQAASRLARFARAGVAPGRTAHLQLATPDRPSRILQAASCGCRERGQRTWSAALRRERGAEDPGGIRACGVRHSAAGRLVRPKRPRRHRQSLSLSQAERQHGEINRLRARKRVEYETRREGMCAVFGVPLALPATDRARRRRRKLRMQRRFPPSAWNTPRVAVPGRRAILRADNIAAPRSRLNPGSFARRCTARGGRGAQE